MTLLAAARSRAALLAASGLLVAACAGCSEVDRPDADDVPARGAAAPAAEVGAGPPVLFDAGSPWNTAVSGSEVHPSSAGLLQQAMTSATRGPDGRVLRTAVDAGLLVDTGARTVPVVAGGPPTVITCRAVACGDGAGRELMDVPADVDPDPRHDGWFTVLDDEGHATDLWRARREDDGSISYAFLRRWDLDGPGFAEPHVAGAHGSGLPLLGGLVRAAELDRGRIDHALALGLPGVAAGSFLPPASSTDGTGALTSLPAGARVVLRPDIRLSPPSDGAANALVQALKTYGAIVVGSAAVPTLYAERQPTDPAAATGEVPALVGDELSGITLADFDVVDFDPDERIAHPASDGAS